MQNPYMAALVGRPAMKSQERISQKLLFIIGGKKG
jgi:hypothetical protein